MKSFTAIAFLALAAATVSGENNLDLAPSHNSYDDNEFDASGDVYAMAFDEYDLEEDEAEESPFLEDVAVERQTLRSCLDNCNRLQDRSNLSAREQCQRDCHLRFEPAPSPPSRSPCDQCINSNCNNGRLCNQCQSTCANIYGGNSLRCVRCRRRQRCLRHQRCGRCDSQCSNNEAMPLLDGAYEVAEFFDEGVLEDTGASLDGMWDEEKQDDQNDRDVQQTTSGPP